MAGLPALSGLREVARRLPRAAVGGQRSALRPATAPLSSFAGLERWRAAPCQWLSPHGGGSRSSTGSRSGTGGIHRRGIHATAASNAAAKRDYYEVLGISKGADEKDIKKACVATPRASSRRPLAFCRRAPAPPTSQ